MDYDDLLNMTWDEVPEPLLLPAGKWLIVGQNAAVLKPKKEGQKLKVVFFYKAKEALEVPEDLLAELPEDYDISINDLSHTVYIETPADWNQVRRHLASIGVEVEGNLFDENGKLAFNKAFNGTEATAQIDTRSYEVDGETRYQNTMKSFGAVEE